MANIEHKLIADADRHEPKGASIAVANQVLKAAGDGTTFFGFVNRSEVAGGDNIVGYQQTLYGSSSAASQQPSSTDSPLQVEFGMAQSITDLTLSTAGLLTFLTAGQYLVEVVLRFGRTAATGSSVMFSRFMKNSTQVLNSNSVTLTDSAQVVPFSMVLTIDAAANDTLMLQVMRDSSGINNGGLFQTTPAAAGWNASPSASIIVSKFKGAI